MEIDRALKEITKKFEEFSAVELIAIWISKLRSSNPTGLIPVWIRIIIDEKNAGSIPAIENLAQEIKKEFTNIEIVFLINALSAKEIVGGVPQGFRILFRRGRDEKISSRN